MRRLSVIASGAWVWLLAALVFLIPYFAYRNLILHGFYDIGGTLYDEGWFAFLIHDSDLQLHQPRVLGNSSWFVDHMSPIFVVASAVGRLVPLTRVQFFAAFTGLSDAMVATAVFWLLVAGYRMTSTTSLLIAAALAVAFSFNGLALAITLFPHFEMFFVGCAMMFLTGLVLGRIRIAVIFFVLALGTREDCGFHLFGLFTLLIAYERWRGVPWRRQRTVMTFALIGLLYSVATMVIQRAFYPERSLLVFDYLGTPPFSTVTVSLILLRLQGWLIYRAYIFLPASVALAWSIRARDPLTVLGYAAFVPWALLQLIAARPLLGTLPSYYGFPFMIASFWPLVGGLYRCRDDPRAKVALAPVIGFTVMIAASFANFGNRHDPERLDLPGGFLSPPSEARQQATDASILSLANCGELGRSLVDQSVLALHPELFDPEQMLLSHPETAADSILFFAHGPESEAAMSLADREGLHERLNVPGTEIVIAGRKRLQSLPCSAPVPGARPID